MALQERSLAVRFQGGVETKLDPKQVPATELLVLENGVFVKGGSIIKRNGNQSLGLGIDGSPTPIAGMKRLANRDNTELLGFTRNRCYSYEPTSDQWEDAGPAFSVVGSDRPAVRTGTQQSIPDQATNGGVQAFAWEDSRGGVWWEVVDATTGRVCRSPEQLDGSGQRPRCCAVGSVVHVYWASGSQIKVVVVNPSRPSAAPVAQVLVIDLNSSNPVYDAEASTYAGGPAILAWSELSTTNFKIAFVHPSGVLGGISNGLPLVYEESTAAMNAASAIAVTSWKAGGAAKLAVAITRTVGAVVFYYSIGTVGIFQELSLVSTTPIGSGLSVPQHLAAVMLDAADATTGQQPIWVAWDIAGAVTSERFTVTAAVNTSFAGFTQRSVGLVSRAFEYQGDAFATVVHDTTYFNTYFTIRLSDGYCVGRHLPGASTGAPSRSHLASMQIAYAMTPAQASIVLPYRERLVSANSDKFGESGLRLISLDFDNKASHQTAQLGRGVYMAGACPSHYDGHVWTEQGFNVGPEYIQTANGNTGQMSSSGQYLYVAWYEWTDGLGEIHRGPTSIGTTVTMGGSDTSVTLTLPSLRLTQKSNVRVCVGRSKLNDSSALYRVTSLDPTTAGAANGYVANDPTVDELTFVDKMSDTVLGTQEPVYTNGGILSNDPTALGSSIAVGKNRLFWTDPSDPNVIHYSQELAQGYGAEIPPDLTTRCDPYGGSIVALIVMDDQVFALKQHAIYLFAGDGPTASGDTSTQGFSSPQLLTSDAGCTDPGSVVLTPVGVMFKSAKGIYLLGRDRQVSYVGAPVEAFNAQTVRRAQLLVDRTQIVFVCDSGKSLLYDYFFQQWSTFTNFAGYDATIVGNLLHVVRTDARVFRETIGAYSDAGTTIVLALETAWIKMHEYLQGFSRFYHLHLIGQIDSPHQLKISFRTDYSPHYSDPVYLDATDTVEGTGWVGWWDSTWQGGTNDWSLYGSNYGDGPYTGTYGGTQPAPYQWRMHLGQVGQSIAFRIEDFCAVGIFGPSFELSEMLITGGVKRQVVRPFAGARST